MSTISKINFIDEFDYEDHIHETDFANSTESILSSDSYLAELEQDIKDLEQDVYIETAIAQGHIPKGVV